MEVQSWMIPSEDHSCEFLLDVYNLQASLSVIYAGKLPHTMEVLNGIIRRIYSP